MSHTIAALKRDHANIAKLLNILESEILAIEVGKTPDYPLMRDVMRYSALFRYCRLADRASFERALNRAGNAKIHPNVRTPNCVSAEPQSLPNE